MKKKNNQTIINKKHFKNAQVIVTGGGSGGHLFPLQSICQNLKQKTNSVIFYVGRNHPLEKEIIFPHIDQFFYIPVGKLRRNWSIKIFLLNLIDLLKIILGFLKSLIIIQKIRRHGSNNTVIFSTGGFVSVPVITAGFLFRVPIVIHEQTSRAGLANRITSVMANKICTSFKESRVLFNKNKIIFTGYPLRAGFYQKVFSTHNLSDNTKKIINSKKSIILFSGGGNGSKLINDWVEKNLKTLVNKYVICHQMGKTFFESCRREYHHCNYFPLGFVSHIDWIALLRHCDILIGRSGAGIVHECIHLNKKTIFVPLAIAQKNEQYNNAILASQLINTEIIVEENLDSIKLSKKIKDLLNKKTIRKKIDKASINHAQNPTQKIKEIILNI